MAKILITGGAGYIGSHTALELLKEGYEVVVYDNLCNSSQESMKRVEELTGKTITFYEGDILNAETLKAMFEKEQVDAVIHCAALKAVGESVRKPLEYYHNNITGTLTLMKVMREVGVKNIVFSSSATVYGNPETMPITEDCPKGQCTNPYGWTKSMMEQIMTDVQAADPEWNVVLLRYFNPVGAHESGRIGEDPKGIPNNLMPYIQTCYHHAVNLCTDLLDSAMEIVELYKCVLVVLDDTCILETDHCDEQTDTCRNCFLQALRHRYCNVLTKSGYGKKQEYNT